MQKTNVKLLYNTPLSLMVKAGRTAWDSFHRGGNYDTETDNITDADREFINRVVNKNRHGSVAEHITYNFDIQGVSRALLQELARHRIASLTVKSTRYTLKELKGEEPFINNEIYDYERANYYLVFNDNELVKNASIEALEKLRELVQSGAKNDVTKYALPEAYRTSLKWTINMRSLQNFLSLRTSKGALYEIRLLAHKIYNALPQKHKFMLEEYVTPLDE